MPSGPCILVLLGNAASGLTGRKLAFKPLSVKAKSFLKKSVLAFLKNI